MANRRADKFTPSIRKCVRWHSKVLGGRRHPVGGVRQSLRIRIFKRPSWSIGRVDEASSPRSCSNHAERTVIRKSSCHSSDGKPPSSPGEIDVLSECPRTKPYPIVEGGGEACRTAGGSETIVFHLSIRIGLSTLVNEGYPSGG